MVPRLTSTLLLALLIAVATVAEDATWWDNHDGVNVALNKPTSSSSTCCGGSAGRAVDGNTNPNFGGRSVTHTTNAGGGSNNPWWKVDLQESMAVATVRVTNRGDCCGASLTRFKIEVDSAVCGENLVVAQGLTGDFVCDAGPLEGSSVTVSIPDTSKRILTLAEVEVYRADPATRALVCYDGNGYDGMAACASCAGPGPSQCLTCGSGNSLVAWRTGQTGDTYEGSCHADGEVTTVTMSRTFREGSFSTKYGIAAVSELDLPCKENNIITADITCKLHKIVACAGRATANETLSCNVTKRAELSSIETLAWAYKSTVLSQACTAAGGSTSDTSACFNPDNSTHAVLHITKLTQPAQACESAVLLL